MRRPIVRQAQNPPFRDAVARVLLPRLRHFVAEFQVSGFTFQVFGIGCPRPLPLPLKRRGWRFVLG
jgi:hypothetical protein